MLFFDSNLNVAAVAAQAETVDSLLVIWFRAANNTKIILLLLLLYFILISLFEYCLHTNISSDLYCFIVFFLTQANA